MVLIDASNKGGQQPDGGDRHGEAAIPRQERGVAQAKEAAWVLCLSMKARHKLNFDKQAHTQAKEATFVCACLFIHRG